MEPTETGSQKPIPAQNKIHLNKVFMLNTMMEWNKPQLLKCLCNNCGQFLLPNLIWDMGLISINRIITHFVHYYNSSNGGTNDQMLHTGKMCNEEEVFYLTTYSTHFI